MKRKPPHIGYLDLRSLRYALQQLQITRECLRQVGAKRSAQAVTRSLRVVKETYRRESRRFERAIEQDWKE